MNRVLRVGIPRDHLKTSLVDLLHDYGLDPLAESDRTRVSFVEANDVEFTETEGYGALITHGQNVTAAMLGRSNDLVLLARWGVGFDRVDTDACTRHGVAVSIAPDGVRRPMASVYVAFILALSHQMMSKDRVVRSGRWRDEVDFSGVGLTDKVLGLVGMGNIGREVIGLIAPFQMRGMVYDPYLSQKDADEAGVELVDLETVMRSADFLCICCMLNQETRGPHQCR